MTPTFPLRSQAQARLRPLPHVRTYARLSAQRATRGAVSVTADSQSGERGPERGSAGSGASVAPGWPSGPPAATTGPADASCDVSGGRVDAVNASRIRSSGVDEDACSRCFIRPGVSGPAGPLGPAPLPRGERQAGCLPHTLLGRRVSGHSIAPSVSESVGQASCLPQPARQRRSVRTRAPPRVTPRAPPGLPPRRRCGRTPLRTSVRSRRRSCGRTARPRAHRPRRGRRSGDPRCRAPGRCAA